MSDHRYEYILFDLDGTIIDSGEGVTNAVAYALEKLGIEVKDKNDLKCFIGPPLLESFKEFYGIEGEDALRAQEYYREVYGSKHLLENEVYDGIPELLERIKASGRKLVVTTSKPEKYALQIAKHFDFEKYFDLIAGADLLGKRSNKAQVLEYALDQLGNPDRSRVILVGDRKYDCDGAAAFGISTIGVLYGYGSEEELREHGAKYIANKPEDVYDFL